MFNKINTGKYGEDIACKVLQEKGYVVIDRNYSKKCGEIDIIARKNKEIYFIEVKTETVDLDELSQNLKDIPRPEEKVDNQKMRRIAKTVQIYALEKHLENLEWKFLVLAILFDPEKKTAKVRIIEDVIPE